MEEESSKQGKKQSEEERVSTMFAIWILIGEWSELSWKEA